MSKTSMVPLNLIPLGEDVSLEELSFLFDKFTELETICKEHNGIGLSAVQIGLPYNMFVVRFDYNSNFGPYGKFGYFLNCKYEPNGDETVDSVEGCLSIRDENGKLRFFELSRYKSIRLTGVRFFAKKDLFLRKIACIIDYNYQGIVFQHEIDHQLGILISDRGKEKCH